MRRATILVGLATLGFLTCPREAPVAAAELLESGGETPYAAADFSLASSLSLAQRALIAEARGDLEERARLLSEVGDDDDDALAHWVVGKLRDRRDWKSVEETIEENGQRASINRYEQFRKGQPDNVAGHVRVALWCRQSGLVAQQAAHWRHVLQLDPNHQMAHLALGHRRINGVWISPDDVVRQQEQASALRASLDKHQQILTRLGNEMLGERPARRDAAIEKFLAIDDADAIPAVAALFATAPTPAIDQAIRWLEYMPDPAAAEVLANWSIDHPSDHVRFVCTRALVRRPYYEYVPLLLERTRTPIASTVIPTFRPDGTLAAFRQVFARETKDNYQVAVHQSVDQRRRAILVQQAAPTSERLLSQGPSNRRLARLLNARVDMRVRAEAAETILQNQRIAAMQNVATEVVNERVRTVLAHTAGTDSDAELPVLWDWWDAYTERQPPPIKLASYSYDLRYTQSTAYGAGKECFVAGTPVITSRGAKPIESLTVGDQVLSKDVQTGRLAWDPVITTTEQPAQPLLQVKTDHDQFRCTGGHLFWVSGKGWTKARDLTYGDVLHGLREPSRVSSVTESSSEATYNLITGRNHNYFVGESKMLSHDFTDQTPTAVRVPGLDFALYRQASR